VSRGGAIMCQCPDGSTASISGCARAATGTKSNSCADLERERERLIKEWNEAKINFSQNPYMSQNSGARMARLQQLDAAIANCR
jgi:hypothetical protein